MSTPISPLSTPLPWDLVSVPYAEVTMPFFRAYAQQALDFAELSPQSRVLDVAAGPGTLSLIAAERGHAVTAVDFAPLMVEQLKRTAEKQSFRVECQVADGQALPFADGNFDAAFSMFGLIFFPDRPKGHRELYRTVKRGGVAVISSWQPMERTELLSDIWRTLKELMPGLPFGDGKAPLGDRDEMVAEMSAAGFDVVEVHEVSASASAETLAATWDFMHRGNAPFALLRHNIGETAWLKVERGMLEILAKKYGTGPQSVTMTANIGVARRS